MSSRRASQREAEPKPDQQETENLLAGPLGEDSVYPTPKPDKRKSQLSGHQARTRRIQFAIFLLGSFAILGTLTLFDPSAAQKGIALLQDLSQRMRADKGARVDPSSLTSILEFGDHAMLEAYIESNEINWETAEMIAQTRTCPLPHHEDINAYLTLLPELMIEPSDQPSFLAAEWDKVRVKCGTLPYRYRGNGDSAWTLESGPMLPFDKDVEFITVECEGRQEVAVLPPRYLAEAERLERKPIAPELTEDLRERLKSAKPMVENIVVFMLDGISREKFAALLPETAKYLQSLQTSNDAADYQVFDFRRHTVQGESSAPNYGAMFSGLEPEVFEHMGEEGIPPSEQVRANWLFDVAEKLDFNTMLFDNLPGGYPSKTSWSSYHLGLVTDYGLSRGQLPAQHCFPQAVFAPSDWAKPNCRYPKGISQAHVRMVDDVTFTTPTYVSDYELCVGQKPTFSYGFEYLSSFLKHHRTRRTFSTVLFHDAHVEDAVYSSVDKAFVASLRQLLNPADGVLPPRSAVFIASDHGRHHGLEYEDAAGFVHHKNPPLLAALPRELLAKQPELQKALKKNQVSITTHHDLYQTIMHLLLGNRGERLEAVQEDNHLRGVPTSQAPHGEDSTTNAAPDQHITQLGQSLLEPLPLNRSCASAGVPSGYCPCELRVCDEATVAKLLQSCTDEINSEIHQRTRHDSSLAGLCSTYEPDEFMVDFCLVNAAARESEIRIEHSDSMRLFQCTRKGEHQRLDFLGQTSMNLFLYEDSCIPPERLIASEDDMYSLSLLCKCAHHDGTGRTKSEDSMELP